MFSLNQCVIIFNTRYCIFSRNKYVFWNKAFSFEKLCIVILKQCIFVQNKVFHCVIFTLEVMKTIILSSSLYVWVIGKTNQKQNFIIGLIIDVWWFFKQKYFFLGQPVARWVWIVPGLFISYPCSYFTNPCPQYLIS